MNALSVWNGGVIIISHDERFITSVAKEVYILIFLVNLGARPAHLSQLWVCADGTVSKFKGDVQSYKVRSFGSFLLRFSCVLTSEMWIELDCEQYQDSAIDQCISRFNVWMYIVLFDRAFAIKIDSRQQNEDILVVFQSGLFE